MSLVNNPAISGRLAEAMAVSAEDAEVNKSGAVVVVYGTLKNGHGNHTLMGKSPCLGTCAVAGQWDLYNTGWFPAIVRRKNGPLKYVVGEAYRVTTDVLRSLDLLEGHPNFYERIKVDTPHGKAWIYTMPDRTVIRPAWGMVDLCWRPSDAEKDWMKGLGDPNNAV